MPLEREVLTHGDGGDPYDGDELMKMVALNVGWEDGRLQLVTGGKWVRVGHGVGPGLAGSGEHCVGSAHLEDTPPQVSHLAAVSTRPCTRCDYKCAHKHTHLYLKVITLTNTPSHVYSLNPDLHHQYHTGYLSQNTVLQNLLKIK